MIRGLFNKVISWPFKQEPKGTDYCDWMKGEKELFYKDIADRKYFSALCRVKTKATKYSFEEMGDLMRALESDIARDHKE